MILTSLLVTILLAWPDGTNVEAWFSKQPEIKTGRSFNIVDYGAVPGSDALQTEAIQRTIDAAFKAGGGTVVIPEGSFNTSSLFFKKGTKLQLQKGATLKGSDNIGDYPYADVHIEGRRQQYIAALINAYGVNGFSISGEGTIDGNGLVYWKAFWERRKQNPQCTNLEVLRPRLIYITESKDVSIIGVTLKDPGFWTTHLYKCSKIRIKDVTISAPTSGVKAPSSDAIDLDACSMVHITGCNISVNDDFIALKGGKGPYADTDPDNGPVEKVLIEKCTFGAGPHVLTFGSECYKASNVILRDSKVNKTDILLRLKIRPDTPQEYSDILIENVSGYAGKLVYIRPWTQFYDPGDRQDIPMSYVRNITIRNCRTNAGKFLDIKVDSTLAQIEQPRMYDNDMFEINYSEKKVGPYTLPDPLTFADGSAVRDAEQWQSRREEILELFQNQMYGRMPKAEPIYCQTLKTKSVCAGFATRRDIRMWFRPDHTGPAVDWMVVTPKDVKGPFPVILTLNYEGNDKLPTDQNGRYIFPLAEMVARGYAFVTANYEDVAPDPDDTLQQKTLPFSKVATLWQTPEDSLRKDNTGAIAAWAWALCRGMDMIQNDKELDGNRVVVTGCSRLGKAALLSGAYDSRFSIVVPIQTGSGGTPLSKRNFGETIESSTTRYTHWFCKNYKAYANNEAAMPFDQHLLLSCVAPRALLVLGFDNQWFDTYGEFLSVKAASPAWELHGCKGLPEVDWPGDYSTAAIGDKLGYARRKRQHGISEYDWKWMLDFADKVFNTGPSSWSAPFIGRDATECRPAYFRNAFAVGEKKPVRVMAYVTAHGIYELNINGQRVGDEFLSPGWTSYHHRLPYRSYDITGLISSGTNEVQAVVAPGWYSGGLCWGDVSKRFYYGHDVALSLSVVAQYSDGSKEIFGTGTPGWQVSDGPVSFANIYDGQTTDFNRTFSWVPADTVSANTDAIVPSCNEPVRAREILPAVRCFRTPKGEKVVDFGQNLTGFERITLHGKKGDTVRVRHAEILDNDGNFYTTNLRTARATSTWILDGKKRTVQPSLTFYGFRYISVEGIEGELDPADFSAVCISSSFPEVGHFECSDPLVNQLQSNIRWSFFDNFVEVPTDCPQRDERLGWTGDAQVFFRTASFLGKVDKFFRKWLADAVLDQREDGGIPRVIPDVFPSSKSRVGATGWADCITIIPWQHFAAYGDTTVLYDCYDAMKRWCDCCIAEARANGGLMKNDKRHYGDWLAFEPTENPFTAQCFSAHSLDIVSQCAAILGHPEDAAYYRSEFENFRKTLIDKYIAADGTVLPGTQTSYVLALQFGLMPEELRAAAAEKLVKNIEEHDYHLTTGFLGTPYLCEVLTETGHTDVAYRLLLQRTCPGWLYPVTLGATTIWERWDSMNPDGTINDKSMNSFNHYSYGAVGDWLYRYAVGIRESSPGYRTMIIHPHPGGGISSMSASTVTPYGKVAVSWKADGQYLKSIHIEIPDGTTASVTLPFADGTKNCVLGPGKYDF